jgi:hypothetical protein
MQQLDLIGKAPRRARMDHARARADYGIERATTSAENANDGWCERACEELRKYARQHGAMFTVELARMAFESKLPVPPDLRAWGQVTRMAVTRGFIARCEGLFYPAASSNGSPKPVYHAGPKA